MLNKDYSSVKFYHKILQKSNSHSLVDLKYWVQFLMLRRLDILYIEVN